MILSFALLMSLSVAQATTPNAIPGWDFRAHSKNSSLEAHTDQIGTLNELAPNSNFLTVPVIVRRSTGLSERTASAQLIRLEAEAAAIMHREKSKPSYVSKRVVDERGVYEAEYGKKKKGLTWVYASVQGNSVVILVGVSRSSTPPKSAREEFFKMARAFTPPET